MDRRQQPSGPPAQSGVPVGPVGQVGRSPGPYYASPYYDNAYGAPGGGDEGSEGFGVARLLRLVRRKWLTIVLVGVFGCVVGALYLTMATRIYRGTCLIEMSARRPRIMGQEGALIEDGASAGRSGTEEVFNTRLARFRTETMSDLALSHFAAILGRPQLAAEDLEALFDADPAFQLIRRSRLVEISFESSDREVAAAGANAYARAAEQMAIDENKAASDSAVAWLQAQADTQRTALETADNAVVAYRTSRDIDGLEMKKISLRDSLLHFNASLVELERQEVQARELLGTVAGVGSAPERAGELPTSIPRREEIQGLFERWTAAKGERDVLLTKYTPKHPDVLAKDRMITLLGRQTMEAIGRARETAESDLDLIRKQSDGLRARIAEQRQLAGDLELAIVNGEARLVALDREREAADISYRGILNRIEEARLSADENTATVKIVELARLPERAVRPRRLRVLALALMLGLAGGLGLAFVTDALDDRVDGHLDLERGVGLRILGVVPHFAHGERMQLATASMNDKFGHVAEVFAGIRSILDSGVYKEHCHSVLVSSTEPEVGKTTTACNLAIASATSGLRTLLIDFDMRRPRVGAIFGVPETKDSLLHVLHRRDASAFDSLTFPASCDNLDIVASRGSADLSAAEIIGGQFARLFMSWARNNYDRVIVDSPPYGLVSDAAVLAGLVGTVLFVCRPDRTRRRSLKHAVWRFRELGVNVVGVVVNDVDFGKSSVFSNFDYQYDYYNYHQR